MGTHFLLVSVLVILIQSVLPVVSTSADLSHVNRRQLTCDDDDGAEWNCAVCNNGKCSQCDSGYFFMDDTQPCIKCSSIEGCALCNDRFGCAQCTDDYLQMAVDNIFSCVRNGTCKESSFNCKVCHSNGCDQCLDNYFKMDYQNPCSSCQSLRGCNGVCNDFFGCSQCRPGYISVKNDTLHICSTTRQRCGCTSPPVNTQCPYTFTSTCVPVSNPPPDADLLDPNDCALWNWETTCDQPCTECTDPRPDPGQCKDPAYTCTSLYGECRWDFSCRDITVPETNTCSSDSCICDAQTPLINCQGDIPPTCNCTIAEDGTCSPAYVCPPVENVCVTDACSQCYNPALGVKECYYYSINQCVSECTANTTCSIQPYTNECGWSPTSSYLNCMNACGYPVEPSEPTTCNPTFSQCDCLAQSGCVSLRFSTDFIVDSKTRVFWYQQCVSEEDSKAYVNVPNFSIVTSQTPGVRAACENLSAPPDDQIGQLITVTNNDLQVGHFQTNLNSFIEGDEIGRSAVVFLVLYAATSDPDTAAAKVSLLLLTSGDIVNDLTNDATKRNMINNLVKSVASTYNIPIDLIVGSLSEVYLSSQKRVLASAVPIQTYVFTATISAAPNTPTLSPAESLDSKTDKGDSDSSVIGIVIGVIGGMFLAIVVIAFIIRKSKKGELEVV